MSEHLQEVVDFVMGDDDSELAKTKAELAYALHALEREIAICQNTQELHDGMVKALKQIEYASRKDSLTEHERLQSVRTVVCAAISRLERAGAVEGSPPAQPEQESAPASVGGLRDDCVMVPKSALAWLFGEGPDANGEWFGQGEDEAASKPLAGKYKRTYWWRSKFRSMIAALSESKR